MATAGIIAWVGKRVDTSHVPPVIAILKLQRGSELDNILIVDDNPVDRRLITAALHEGPWNLIESVTARDALKIIDSHPVNLLITDLEMPEMDGIELIRQVKQTCRSLPVVLVTNSENSRVAIGALKAGATSYCPKRSLMTDLASTVTQVLEIASRMHYTHDENLFPVPGNQLFVLENDLSLIGPTVENLQSHLPRWSDGDRLQIAMAVEEAITNAMHHGNLEVSSDLREGGDNEQRYYQAIQQRRNASPFSQRKVRIEAEFSQHHICIQITDDGRGFCPASVADPRDTENLRRISGRGLFLIRTFMDQIAYNAKGNQITMTKLRKRET